MKELEESGEVLGPGIKEDAFSARVLAFVQNNMQLLELAKEDYPGYIYLASFNEERNLLRVLMGELRGIDIPSGVAKDYIR